MENKNAQARRYLREVRGWLPCAGKLKRKVLKEINATVEEFLNEKPGAEYGDLVARFGTPQQIASSYVDEMETRELLYHLRIRKRIVRVAVITAILLISMWSGVVGIALANELNSSDGYSTLTVVDDSTDETVWQEVHE